MARIDKQTAVLLSESLEEIYAEVVDRLIVNICKYLTVGDAKRTADWEVRKLQEIGQLKWQYVHPLLKILPVDWKYTIPYGLLHAPEPSPVVRKFLQAVDKITKS